MSTVEDEDAVNPTTTGSLAKPGLINVQTGQLAVLPPANWLTRDQATMAGGALDLFDDVRAGWHVMGHCGLNRATIGSRAALRAWITPGVPVVFRPTYNSTVPTVAAPFAGRMTYNVVPGRRYSFTVDVWLDTAIAAPGYTVDLRLVWLDAAGAILSTVTQVNQVATVQAWRTFLVTGIAPTGAAQCRPFLKIKDPNRPPVGAQMLTAQASSAERGTAAVDASAQSIDGGWRWSFQSAAVRLAPTQAMATDGTWAVEFRPNGNAQVLAWPYVPSDITRVVLNMDAYTTLAGTVLQYWTTHTDDDMVPTYSSYGSTYALTQNAWTAVPFAMVATTAPSVHRTWGWAWTGAAADFSAVLTIDKRSAIMAASGTPAYVTPPPDRFVAISRAGLYEGDVTAWSDPGTLWANNRMGAEHADLETNTNTASSKVAGWRLGSGSSGTLTWDTAPHTGTHNLLVNGGTSLAPWVHPADATTGYFYWGVTPGKPYTAMAAVQVLSLSPNLHRVDVELRIEFVDASSVVVANGQARYYGFPNDISKYVRLVNQAVAPAGAVSARMLVSCVWETGSATPCNFRLDSAGFYDGYVGGWTAPGVAPPARTPVRVPAITVVDP